MNWYKKAQLKQKWFSIDMFKEPLRKYIYQTFQKEYNKQQTLLPGFSMDNLVNELVNKILQTPIDFDFKLPNEEGTPHAQYDYPNNKIEVFNVDIVRYNKDKSKTGYATYINSMIFHELIHAVNYIKKLYENITYNPYMLGKDYYLDPEEIRAYRAMMVTFLHDHLGLAPSSIFKIMNKYTTAPDKDREKYLKQIYENKFAQKIIKNIKVNERMEDME